jgi:hypothetical protein
LHRLGRIVKQKRRVPQRYILMKRYSRHARIYSGFARFLAGWCGRHRRWREGVAGARARNGSAS